jgi:pyridoxal phosphate-dependent aminotransferase EpsN
MKSLLSAAAEAGPLHRSDRARIFLSPPHVGRAERELVAEAFDSNWIAPVGPNLAALEEAFCAASGAAAAACLSSGTAALHLGVRLAGVRPGDEVFCSTFTFAASAGPILYEGARPVFIDSDRESWNMDPGLLAEALAARSAAGRLPRAILVTDIYGQCARWDEIAAAAGRHGVPIIEDAAEAVGATYRGKWAGRFGLLGAYSFNGNKIMTTSCGGLLLSDDVAMIEHAKKLATQARDPAPHYQHSELGYNYRMSNLLAGIGRGQLAALPERIRTRRGIFEHYVRALGDLPGVGFMPEFAGSRGNRWLTCMTIDPAQSDVAPADVLAAMAADNIEGRPLWKPLHCQPLYAGVETFGGRVAEELFARGLCLPSGSAMSEQELDRVVGAVRGAFGAN